MATKLRNLVIPLLLSSADAVYGEAIEDNSFLLEEAYNQEAGVVQFIQTYQKDKSGDSFYSLTVEAPAPNQSHQLSFTLPYSHTQGPPDVKGTGDVALNYRYQLLAGETVAVAPRLSILVPTGDHDKGLGIGATGLQTNWAVSVKAHPCLVVHMNVGATYLPGVKNLTHESVDLYGSNAALSLVWLLHENFNFLTEFVTSSMQSGEASSAAPETMALINPGFRYAVNFETSQLVLGASVPTPVLYSKGSASYFAYLSYEPKLW